MMVAEATETCKGLIIGVNAYFTSVNWLLHYISVNFLLFSEFRGLS